MHRLPRVSLLVRTSSVLALGLSLASAALSAAPADAIQFLLTLGVHLQHGTAPGTFTAPQGGVYDATGRLFVSDTEWSDLSSDRIQVFDPDHQYLFALATNDGTPLAYPIGMAVDATGKLIVADALNDRIVVFDAVTAGSPLPPQQLASAGVRGNYDPLDIWSADRQPGPPPLSPLVFYFPTGVALKAGTRLLDPADTTGRVAVVDDSNHRVVVLDAMLRPLYDFGGHAADDLDSPAGSMEYPWDVAIDAAGQFYVSDADNSRVQVFVERVSSGQRSAQFVRMFGSRRDGSGQMQSAPGDFSRPYGLEFDREGRLWVADPDLRRALRVDVTRDIGTPASPLACEHIASMLNENRCQVATSDGLTYDAVVLGTLGSGGEPLFATPMAIAVSPSGELAIADTNNHEVKIFAASPIALSFAGAGTPPAATLNVNQSSPFAVTLKNSGALPLAVTIAPSVASNGEPFDGVFDGELSGNLAAGASRTFALTFTPLQSGPFQIDVDAAGDAATIAGGHVTTGTLRLGAGTVVSSPGISVMASGSGTVASAGDIYTLQLRLRNPGPTTLTHLQPAIAVEGASIVEALDPPAALTLAPMQSVLTSYRYRLLSTGAVTFHASASAQTIDPVDGTPLSVAAAAAAITLTVVADAKAPITTAIVPPASAAGWYNAPITVRLEAADNAGGSGVESIAFVIAENNMPQTVAGSSVNVTMGMQGPSHLRFSARDVAGNVEAEHSVMVRIDTYAPTMGTPQIASALPPAHGWYRTDPTITFVAGDGAGGSGLASIAPAVTVTTNGANQVRTGVAIDNAGNRSEEASASVNVDKVAPILTCAAARPPDRAGWYNAAVTIACAAADYAEPAGFSGMHSVRASCAAGNDGTGTQTASCTYATDGTFTFLAEATDVAGNTSTATMTIRIDRTPPELVCATIGAGQLWPPNHKLEPWDVSVLVRDALSGSGGFRLAAYSSSEAADALADGRTSVDMAGWLPNVVVSAPTRGVTSGFVRSERSGIGTGRLYRLRYEALDSAGNAASCVVTLLEVPHDQRK